MSQQAYPLKVENEVPSESGFTSEDFRMAYVEEKPHTIMIEKTGASRTIKKTKKARRQTKKEMCLDIIRKWKNI